MKPLAPLLLAACASLFLAPGARAGIPAASTSYVAPQLVTCPAGDSTFVVISRHVDGAPWAEGPVTLSLCGCPGLHVTGALEGAVDSSGCLAEAMPDLEGVSRFGLEGGGLCPGDTLVVRAEGIPLGFVTRVASLDQDGDLRVDATDVALVQSRVGTTDPTADFDGDGTVTAADVAIVEAHLGHVAPGIDTGVPPGTTGALALSDARPNPFRREATVVLTIAVPSRIELAVFDAAGRRIATPFRGELGAGAHALAWDGRRDDGSAAASGLYFLRVATAGRTLERKAVRIPG